MGYFREVPDLDYISPLEDRTGSQEFVKAKNLFRRVKLRDDIKGVVELYNEYQIEGNDRPDVVAQKVYDNAELDWVVLITNNIINVRNEWPLSDRDLRTFCSEKYGSKITDIRYYETTQVKDSNNRLILGAGSIVDANFTIPDPDDKTATLNPVAGVTNIDYETRKNDEKRGIFILRREYLSQFLEDTKTEMFYRRSSQYVTSDLKRGDNIRTKSP